MNKKKKSLFYSYLYDSLKFYETAVLIYNTIKNPSEPIYPDLRAQEEMKIFHMARSFEALSKAYLASYGLLIVYPSLLISAVKKGVYKAPRHLEKELNSLSILARQALNPKKMIEKLKHDPIGRSQLPDLFKSTSNFFQQINEREFASLYNKISEFLHKPVDQRNYAEIMTLRKEITRVMQLKNVHERFYEILKKCIEGNINEDICKNLTQESKEMLSSFSNKEYLLDQILSILDLGFQEMFDGILYASYLARAAEIADYTVGRTEDDEKYLAEIIDHQQEIFDFLSKMQEINKVLIKDDELDDFMSQIEEEARKYFKHE